MDNLIGFPKIYPARWIVIYTVDSTIQRLCNQGLVFKNPLG